jgi:uncharacterized protein YhaN
MALRVQQIEISQVGPFGNLILNFQQNPKPGKAEIHILTGENGTLNCWLAASINVHPILFSQNPEIALLK